MSACLYVCMHDVCMCTCVYTVPEHYPRSPVFARDMISNRQVQESLGMGIKGRIFPILLANRRVAGRCW